MLIDFVIPFVNSNDKYWKELYNIYQDETHEEYKSQRFRDTHFLKYVFRSIGKYAQWVNKVFLIVQSMSQVPDWVNTENVNIVLHKEFIPKEYLPVFNCNTIETHLHLIPGLSDYFIYFNDDTILNQPCYKLDFFNNGKCNVYPLKNKITKQYKATWYNCLINDKTEIDKILNIEGNENYIYKFAHTVTPLYKPLCEECYNKLENEIKNRTTRFRELSNFNQHLFAYYIYATGNSNKISVPVIYVNMHTYFPQLTKMNTKTICINDIVLKDLDMMLENKKKYVNDLEKKFSNKCKYEK